MSNQVLVIRKPDATIHVVPLQNEAALRSMNNKFPPALKWKFETMDEEKAKKLPFIDPHFIGTGEAVKMLSNLQEESAAKDSKIEELMAQLAAFQSGNSAPNANSNTGSGTGTADNSQPLTAAELIEKIKTAITEFEVDAIVGDDTRISVLNAAKKQIASFTQQ